MNIPFIQAACYTKGRLAKINYLVIHAEQGFYQGTISWFKNPASQVSAHYVLGQEGQITQMVKEADRAWAVCRANSFTVSLEHEDRGKCMSDPNWFLPGSVMWNASVQLAADICIRNNIPTSNIIGHSDPMLKLYGNSHACPGIFWNKDKYRQDVADLIATRTKVQKIANRAQGQASSILSRITGFLYSLFNNERQDD